MGGWLVSRGEFNFVLAMAAAVMAYRICRYYGRHGHINADGDDLFTTSHLGHLTLRGHTPLISVNILELASHSSSAIAAVGKLFHLPRLVRLNHLPPC